MPYQLADDDNLVTMYSPSLKKVACALLSAAFNCDPRVHNIVGTENWFVYPPDDMVRISATEEQWKMFRDSPMDKRPGPEHFAASIA